MDNKLHWLHLVKDENHVRTSTVTYGQGRCCGSELSGGSISYRLGTKPRPKWEPTGSKLLTQPAKQPKNGWGTGTPRPSAVGYVF